MLEPLASVNYALGNAARYAQEGRNPLAGALRGAVSWTPWGDEGEKTTFGKVYEKGFPEFAKEHPWVTAGAGLATDILTDPIFGPISKLGKLTALGRAGQKAQAVAKVASKVERAGVPMAASTLRAAAGAVAPEVRAAAPRLAEVLADARRAQDAEKAVYSATQRVGHKARQAAEAWAKSRTAAAAGNATEAKTWEAIAVKLSEGRSARDVARDAGDYAHSLAEIEKRSPFVKGGPLPAVPEESYQAAVQLKPSWGEQGRAGQRALYQLGDRVVIAAPRALEGIERGAEAAGRLAMAVPGAKGLKGLFTAGTGIPELDELGRRSRWGTSADIEAYNRSIEGIRAKAGKLGLTADEWQEARELAERPLNATGTAEFRRQRELLEKVAPVTAEQEDSLFRSLAGDTVNLRAPSRAEVGQIAGELTGVPERMLATEQAVGVLSPDTLEVISRLRTGSGLRYQPHIITEEGRESLRRSFPKEFSSTTGEMSAKLKNAITRKFREMTTAEANKAAGLGLFETDPLVALAARSRKSARAVAGARFFEEARKYADPSGAGIPITEAGYTLGRDARKLLSNPDGSPLAFDPDVAPDVARYAALMYGGTQGSGSTLRKALKVFDGATNYIKRQLTVSALPFVLRNAQSNKMLNWIGGVERIEPYADAARAMAGSKVAVAAPALGRKLGAEELIELATREGAITPGAFVKTEELGALNDAVSRVSWNRVPLLSLKGDDPASVALRRLNSHVENHDRLAHFVDKLEKGYDPSQAAASSRRYLFDYSEEALSPFERDVMTRAMPFYRWIRRNFPLQVQMLIEEPSKTASLSKTASAIAQGPGEFSVAEQMDVRKLFGDVVPLPTSRDEKGTAWVQPMQFLAPQSDLGLVFNPLRDAYEDYYTLDEDPGRFARSRRALGKAGRAALREGVSRLHPLVNPMISATTGWDPYFERVIDPLSRITEELETLPAEGGTTGFLGMPVRRSALPWLKLLRPLAELDRLNPGDVFGQQVGPEGVPVPGWAGGSRETADIDIPRRLLRATLGWRAYPIDTERGDAYADWRTKKLDAAAEAVARHADRYGNQSERARAERVRSALDRLLRERYAR